MTKRRVSQIIVLLVGAVAAVVMLWLGLWQMQVFERQQDKDAAQRAAQAPIELLEQMPTSGQVGDVYGRTVRARGRWAPAQDVVVVGPDGARRQLSALLLADGRVLPVVRGKAGAGVAPPKDVEIEVTGVFLPSEPGESHPVGPGELGSVRLPQLAQRWPQQVAPGFVTLRAEDARAQGLEPATVSLPSGHGAIRNWGYAIQWWAFAAFAVGMSVVIARQMRDRVDGEPVTPVGAKGSDA